MTLPNSMDYLTAGGVLNFDAASYLNNPNARQMPFENPMSNSKLLAQPTKDSFMSKAKNNLKEKGTWKKVAAGVVVAALAGVGIYKGAKGVKNIGQTFKNAQASAGTFFQNLGKKFKV